jgi:hypothetical protein
MPDYRFGRCDGHHEMDDFLKRKARCVICHKYDVAERTLGVQPPCVGLSKRLIERLASLASYGPKLLLIGAIPDIDNVFHALPSGAARSHTSNSMECVVIGFLQPEPEP